MFRETYKAANDDIKADDELLNKVLNQKPRRKPPVYKYSSIAAAAVIVCVGLASIPRLNDIKTDPQSDMEFNDSLHKASSTDAPQRADKDITENSEYEDRSNIAAAELSGEDIDTAKQSAEKTSSYKKSQNDIALKERSIENDGRTVIAEAKLKTELGTKNNKTEIKPDVREYSEAAAEEVLLKSAKADRSAVTEDNTADISERNTYTRYVVLHANSADYSVEEGSFASAYNAYDSGSEYRTEEWTMDDYFDYLGENVFEKVSLPPDFNYVGEYNMTVSVDENGKPGFDSQIFPYEGADDRYVTVITSKNTTTADSYIEDERYQKSDICGTDAVVIGGEEEYKSYIVSNDISHIVTSNGITEDELGDLLVSIGGKDE